MYKVKACEKVCSECAFNGSTENTLYAEAFDTISKGYLFPCHMYLKSKTGCEYLGVEKLKEIKVCRGYILYQLKYGSKSLRNVPIWQKLFKEVSQDSLDDILSLEELINKHTGLREEIYLGN